MVSAHSFAITSLVTTFNAYLPFYEDVVLRKLIGNGVRHNMVLMDAAQCAQSVATHPPRLAGSNYSLVPMQSTGAFHPKVILLVGKNGGLLFVGSHNLTLSGFGYNRELTNLIEVENREDEEGISILQSAWKQVSGWLMLQPDVPDHMREMLRRFEEFAPWLKKDNSKYPSLCRFISSQEGSLSLWQQFRDSIKGEVDKIILAGAFFDSRLEFIRRIQLELQPTEIHIGIDPDTVKVPGDFDSASVVFHNAKALGPNKEGSEVAGYLHAKAIAIITTDGEIHMTVGSANPSFPAWLKDGLSGNTEAMLVRIGESAKIAAQELSLLDIPNLPKLSAEDWKTAADSWHQKNASNDLAVAPVGVVIANDEKIIMPIKGEIISVQYELMNSSDHVLLAGQGVPNDQQLKISVSEIVLPKVRFVRLTVHPANASVKV